MEARVMKTRAMLLMVFIAAIVAQGLSAVGTWKNFTSMKEVRSITRAGSEYWAATGGGLFAWNSADNSYKLFTNAEGLRSIDLTVVTVDKQGDIWTGTTTGVIHVYSPQDGSWRYISDIANSTEYTDKNINNLTVAGDTVFICTEFGLAIFRIGSFGFGDTYKQFGSLQGNVRVSVSSVVIFNDSIRATVSDNQSISRVAVASLSNQNLLPPSAWTLQIVGDATVVPKQLSTFGGMLFAGTNVGLYVYNAGVWNPIPGLSGQFISGLSASQSFLHVVTQNRVYAVDGQLNVQQIGGVLPFPASSVTSSANTDPLVGSTGGGILVNDSSWTSRIPNGPNSSQFLDVAVSGDGVLWAASGYNGNGQGIYRYNGKNWKSFTTQNSPLPTNDYYRIAPGCDGSVWVSSYGKGIVQIPTGVDTITGSQIYGLNVGLLGIPGDTTFIVPSNVSCDGQGNVWMNIVDAADKYIMAQRRSNGAWTRTQVVLNGTPLRLLQDLPVNHCITIDQYGNLWSCVKQSGIQGVVSLGNRGSLGVSDVAYHLTVSDGLPDNNARTIVADQDGQVWVGTDAGIGIILDPNQPNRAGGIASYSPMPNTVINCIAVDALNQKWVGTPNGVVLWSPDGTQVLAEYTVASTNGKLIDDNVQSIAIDGNTGTVYFATLSGLASLTTTAATPKESFDNLIVSPNPFRIPSSTVATIDGLVGNSTIKILTIDGRLVREIIPPGGRIGFWDGTDDQGNMVSTGVYLVVASSDKDKNVGKAKIAVIRR